MAQRKAAQGAMRMWQIKHLQLNQRPSPILNSSILVGRVLPGKTPYEEASGFRPGEIGLEERDIEVRVPYNVYDSHLQMFFQHEWDFAVSSDNDNKLDIEEGDIVLIEKHAEKFREPISMREKAHGAWWEPKIEEKGVIKRKEITHNIIDVIFKLGDVIEPTTGKPVVADRYRDEIEKAAKLYGQSNSDFDYAKAPKRGWQRGKKDFTARKT